jgi:hypothetical protein
LAVDKLPVLERTGLILPQEQAHWRSRMLYLRENAFSRSTFAGGVWGWVRYLVLVMTVAGLVPSLVKGSQPIQGLFGTGLNSSGGWLGSGEIDPHYRVAFSEDPTGPGPAAFVVDPTTAPPTWLPNSADSQWISPAANPGALLTRGRYVYYASFDLTGLDPKTAMIEGKLAVDNSIRYLLINGVRASLPAASFEQFSTFVATQGFVPGLNVITFDTENLPGFNNTTSSAGLRVELSGHASLAGPMGAESVVRNISTGLNENLLPLVAGDPDGDYTLSLNGISLVPSVSFPERNAAWLPDVASNGSRWIGLPFPQSAGLPGTYRYETMVDLTGYDPATTFLRDLRVSSDDSPVSVFINDVLVWESGSVEFPFRAFSMAGDVGLGHFRDGSNIIRFDVVNQFFSGHPIGLNSTGLRVEGSVVAIPIPESSSVVLLSLAFVSASLLRWRRQ